MSRSKRERFTTFPKITDEDLKDKVYMHDPTFFDIETGPVAPDELEQFIPPFEAPKNIKKPELIEEAIAKKKSEWFDKVALSPLTGKILAIGLLRDGKYTILEGDEKNIINDFWNYWRKYDPQPFVGFNIFNFDMPYILRRGYRLGIDHPRDVQSNNRYWKDNLIDLMNYWSLGVYGERISLDNFCKFLGVKGKSGSGKFFSELYEEDHDAAIEYLKNDLDITAKVWEKCG